MTKQEAIEILKNTLAYDSDFAEAKQMAIEALEQESIKFYYVESLDDYWVGRRLDNFYYATWHRRFGFIWSHSKYLPWGEHIVDENTLWKEHTYPSEPKEIPFTEWIVGFTKKYFQQEPKRGEWLEIDEYSSDVISREEVKKQTTKKNSIWNTITDSSGRGLDEILDSIPSAQPERKTDGDTISRQAAIDAFDGVKVDEKTEYDIGYNDGIDLAVSKLSVLPSAQPFTAEQIQTMQELESAQLEKAYELGKADRPKWIPVSERLPEIDKRVIVTGTMWGMWEVDIDRWNGERWVKYGGYVSAWMPLPEAYREDGEEE